MSAEAAATTPLQRALITGSVMLATIMQAVDTTIANVALPHMQGSMSATQDQISWVLTSYIVAAAIMTPPTGVLAARFGRKRLFVIGVTGFTIASMLCGGATSLGEIVTFRLLQGAFGASLVPLSQAVLLDTYPREKHGSAMAIWGVGIMVGPIVGPTLGGYLTETFSWNWVFYVNLPVGILALAGILAVVPESERAPDRRFDFFGFALLSLAIGAFQLMLDRGESQAWFSSTEIVVEAVLAGTFLYMFLVHMFAAERPFLEPGLFRDRNFAVGLVLIFISTTVLLGTLALLPPFLQHMMEYPVETAGLVLAPRGIGTMAAMLLVGRLIGRYDSRVLIFIGLSLTAYALWEMSRFSPTTPMSEIVWTGAAQGLGLGFIFVPLSTTTFSTLAPRYRNEGTAMFSLMRNIGGSVGISILVTLLARSTQGYHAGIADSLTPFRDTLQPSLLPRAWDWTSTRGVIALNDEVTHQATLLAYLADFQLMMWVAILATPLLLLLKRPQRNDEIDIAGTERA